MAILETELTANETNAPMLRASCDRKALLKALTAVKGSVATRTHLPICTAVKIRANHDTLTVYGTNLDTSMAVFIPAQMPHTAECVADFKGLFNAVKTLKSATVDLSHDGKTLTVDGGRGAISVPARYPVEDFPIIPATFDGRSFMVPTADLRDIAASIVPFAATDDTRPILTGALFTVDGDTLTVATADGWTLATRTTTDMTGDDGSFILPASTLKLVKHLPDGLTFVATAENRNGCEIHSGNVRIVSRLIEGQYPDLKRIIPTKFEGYFNVKRSDLAEVLPMLLPVARDNQNTIKFSVETDTYTGIGVLTVSASSVESGEVTAQVDVLVSGTIPHVQFNGTFIKRIVDTVDSTLLTWKVSGPNSASVIIPTDGPDHTVVIMPMHTGAR